MAASDTNSAQIGADVARVEGHLKVTGQARYGSDVSVANPAYAYLVTSGIARGRITAIDEGDAREIPGVLDILTYRSVGNRIKPGKLFSGGGYVGSTIAPLRSAEILHAGQVVAVVLADAFETAREAAHKVRIAYDEEPAAAGFDSPGAKAVDAAKASKSHEDPAVGSADGAFASAAVKIEAEYATPTQHHNPIELFTTTCAWNGDQLTIWEPSQYVHGFKNGVADQLGIDPDTVRVVSEYVGGAFGARGALTQRTAIIALAARQLARPVKLAVARDQGFTIASYRAETRHRIRLGAARDGKLQSLIHEGEEVTSRPDVYMVAGTDIASRIYACPNIRTSVAVVHVDRNTPGFMRSPPEVPYMFALESALDELAVELGMDPVELRRINNTQTEPIKGLPYTSRSLMQCYDAAAKAFGWAKRSPRPQSMRDGEWDVGWGCATAVYPTNLAPAAVRVILSPRGTVRVQTAAHDIGTGAYTAIAITAADALGVPLKAVSVELGDSTLPPAPVAGGSNTTASVCNAVAQACREIVQRLSAAVAEAPDGTLSGADPSKIAFSGAALHGPEGRSESLSAAIEHAGGGAVEAHVEYMPDGVAPDGLAKLHRGVPAFTGGTGRDDRIQCAFGAEFVEVRVHRRTREIRCPRIVGAFAAGRIVSRRTAESQLLGGMVWGISSALHEATEIDTRWARYYNTDLSEYLIPVNADVGETQVIIIPEEDNQVNPLGLKGLGELGNVGTNAAIANAAYHATGVRIRDLPIRIEKLL